MLSRLQFAWVVAFHILLPAFTVGLSCYIATLETLWWLKKDARYLRLSAFWIKIFAISFGMGVVSGIVMPFQFGTNWSRFIDATGSVIGPLLGYEVITAFFLEAAFLGVLLFGRRLVPQPVHVLSAYLVAFGTLLSSFWILASNSWMQTPVGHEVVDGLFVPADLVQLIFNPSLPYRLVHTVTAFVITTALVVLGVGAHYLLQKRHLPEARSMVWMSLVFLTVMVPFQVVVGDLHGVNTLKHQPAKLAAIEGLWDTTTHVPLSLFAIPDEEAERNRYEIAIPAIGSLYLTHGFSTDVQGLKAFPREDRPPVAVPYFAFRLMVGLGLLMLAIVISGWIAHRRGRLFESTAFLKFARWGMPLGFVAVLAGWFVTEVGRQPWVVYGLMRTADAVTPSLVASDVALSFAAYIVAYVVMFSGGFILLRRMVRIGPQEAAEQEAEEAEERRRRAARPLSAVTDEHERGTARPAGATLGPQRELDDGPA